MACVSKDWGVIPQCFSRGAKSQTRINWQMTSPASDQKVRYSRPVCIWHECSHYSDVIMSAMATQITSLTIVNSIVYSGADQRKHQCFASLAFVRGIHRWSVNSPHKGPVTGEMFPVDDVIMPTEHIKWDIILGLGYDIHLNSRARLTTYNW